MFCIFKLAFVTSFEAKEGEECLLIPLRRTTSCYRLGYCDVLVNHVYQPKKRHNK